MNGLPNSLRRGSRADFAAICIALFMLTLFSDQALAAESKPISFRATEKSFQQFIAGLRAAAQKKDANAVYSVLAPNYYIARDFGGSFDPAASPTKNFSMSFEFNNARLRAEFKDRAWNEFREMISGRKFEKKRDGQLCTPHGALDKQPFPHSQLCFRKLRGGWRIQGHINGGD